MINNLPPPAKPSLPATAPRRRRWFGYALLAISTVTWCTGVFAAPWLPGSVTRRATTAGVLLVIGEVTFWAAIPFLGKELVLAFRRFFNPIRWWRRLRDRRATGEPAQQDAEETCNPSPPPNA